MMKIAVLCGGPSLERGISLNSARSVSDHLHGNGVEVVPIYFDQKKNAYQISRAQLYCNTPSDFDFKLHSTSKPLSEAELKKLLKSVDLAFPAMHGQFGEDGQIQRYLTKTGVPFTGSPEEACKIAFDKFNANEFIREAGFYSPPSIVLKSHLSDHKKLITGFFKTHQIKRAIVKPATGGSSISVFSVSNPVEALDRVKEIFSKRIDTRVVIEPFCEGTEFTVIILQNRFGLPVAIMPSEIEISYAEHQIFDYRKKYLATRQVTYHCPPRFENGIIEKIQVQAEQLFTLLGMRDFARFDGWLMKDGEIWFSDFNPISGMEQNSFLFMQTARLGMTHGDALRYIVKSACRRYRIPYCGANSGPDSGANGGTNGGLTDGNAVKNSQLTAHSSQLRDKKKVNVLFGGDTAERQVSVMSGTNVWLKLLNSTTYEPHPYLLDTEQNVWKLPYALTLNHTVEEIMESCQTAEADEARLRDLIRRVITKLSVQTGELSQEWFLPQKMSLKKFIDESDFVFIGLHGGIGENGVLQKRLEKARKPFNGSRSQASALCMDKFKTGETIAQLRGEGIYTAEKRLENLIHFKHFSETDYRNYWKKLTLELVSKTLIVKPVGDGCSAGIARLFSPADLKTYINHAQAGSDLIPEGSLKDQHGLIEMPTTKMHQVLFERFVITDKVRVIDDQLKWQEQTGWIEITMGLLGKKGHMKAMHPSLTVAHGDVLSLEEKFQGGTGVNITPPPAPYVKPAALKKAMTRMEKVAKVLGLNGYARIDAFMHTRTGELIIIEANTTPGLTPSTVIYHQALAEKPPMYPTEFLEGVVQVGLSG